MKKVLIIDYKMGNVASVQKAFQKIGAGVLISNKKIDINQSEYLVLPGVGAFGDGIKNLVALSLVEIIEKKVFHDKIPFLGICLGMQLLAQKGYEFGTHQGLGWIDGRVIKMEVPKNIRLPHIGWNNIEAKEDVLLQNILDSNFYFDHSYHLQCEDPSMVVAQCNYGIPFTAAIHKDNIFGTQFHPEKSQNS